MCVLARAGLRAGYQLGELRSKLWRIGRWAWCVWVRCGYCGKRAWLERHFLFGPRKCDALLCSVVSSICVPRASSLFSRSALIPTRILCRSAVALHTPAAPPQACWQAGVDLNEVVGGHDALKEQLRSKGVPDWKIQTVRGREAGRQGQGAGGQGAGSQEGRPGLQRTGATGQGAGEPGGCFLNNLHYPNLRSPHANRSRCAPRSVPATAASSVLRAAGSTSLTFAAIQIAPRPPQMRPEIRPRHRGALSSVLLVGGATRMPAVRRFLTHMTGIVPKEAAVDPDEAVALGAAVQVRNMRRFVLSPVFVLYGGAAMDPGGAVAVGRRCRCAKGILTLVPPFALSPAFASSGVVVVGPARGAGRLCRWVHKTGGEIATHYIVHSLAERGPNLLPAVLAPSP